MFYFILTLLYLLLPISANAKTIYIMPFSHETYLYYQPRFNVSDNEMFCYYLREGLEKHGYKIKFIQAIPRRCRDVTAFLIFNRHDPYIKKGLSFYPKERSILFVFEPPLTLPSAYSEPLSDNFGKIFVMLDNKIDNQNYFKFHYPQPRLRMIDEVVDFSQKKLCTLIATNVPKMTASEWLNSNPGSLYPERVKMISFFESLNSDEFDLYGLGWEGYKCWKGTIADKWVVLNNYKFCICYENMTDQSGYISEKIFDCFNGGCVPVYWGASNITDYIPKECFIDRRDFNSEVQLYEYLKSIDQSTYEAYLASIRSYLQSHQAYLFSIDHFIQTVLNSLSHL